MYVRSKYKIRLAGGGKSLYFQLPAYFVRKQGLKKGDVLLIGVDEEKKALIIKTEGRGVPRKVINVRKGYLGFSIPLVLREKYEWLAAGNEFMLLEEDGTLIFELISSLEEELEGI